MLIYITACIAVSLDYGEILFKVAYSVLGYPCSQTAKLQNFLYRVDFTLTSSENVPYAFQQNGKVSSSLNFLVLITLSSKPHVFLILFCL